MVQYIKEEAEVQVAGEEAMEAVGGQVIKDITEEAVMTH
jgi:hypothetical protein